MEKIDHNDGIVQYTFVSDDALARTEETSTTQEFFEQVAEHVLYSTVRLEYGKETSLFVFPIKRVEKDYPDSLPLLMGE
jgi:hypothetical protein